MGEKLVVGGGPLSTSIGLKRLTKDCVGGREKENNEGRGERV